MPQPAPFAFDGIPGVAAQFVPFNFEQDFAGAMLSLTHTHTHTHTLSLSLSLTLSLSFSHSLFLSHFPHHCRTFAKTWHAADATEDFANMAALSDEELVAMEGNERQQVLPEFFY